MVLYQFNSVGDGTLIKLNSMGIWYMDSSKSINGWSVLKSNSMGGGVKKKKVPSSLLMFFFFIWNSPYTNFYITDFNSF